LNTIAVLFCVLPSEFHWMYRHVILKISYKQACCNIFTWFAGMIVTHKSAMSIVMEPNIPTILQTNK